MTIQERLTKENFWNELLEKFPKGMKVFCDWIDQYKAMVGWKRLFNEGYVLNKDHKIGFMVDPGKTQAPKFHDIPYAMQMGIWIAFVQDRGGCSWEIDDMMEFDLAEDIANYIMFVDQDEITKEYVNNLTPEQRARIKAASEDTELPFP